VVSFKVTPLQKSGARRLDAWAMRNLLQLPLWIVVAFFALSGHAQQAQHIQPERPPEMVYYANTYADYYHVPREIVYAVITQSRVEG